MSKLEQINKQIKKNEEKQVKIKTNKQINKSDKLNLYYPPFSLISRDFFLIIASNILFCEL